MIGYSEGTRLVEQPKQIEPDLFRKLRNQIKSLVVGAAESSAAVAPLERIPFDLAHAPHSSFLFFRQFSRSNWIGLIGIGSRIWLPGFFLKTLASFWEVP